MSNYHLLSHQHEDRDPLSGDALLVELIPSQAVAVAARNADPLLSERAIGRLIYRVVGYPDLGGEIMERAERRVSQLLSLTSVDKDI